MCSNTHRGMSSIERRLQVKVWSGTPDTTLKLRLRAMGCRAKCLYRKKVDAHLGSIQEI
jgi:hypothetical protein